MEQIVKELATLPLIVRGSNDDVFKTVRALQEQARKIKVEPSDSAKRAAEEIHKLCDQLAPEIPHDSTSYAPTVEQITAIISKYLLNAAAPADNDAEGDC